MCALTEAGSTSPCKSSRVTNRGNTDSFLMCTSDPRDAPSFGLGSGRYSGPSGSWRDEHCTAYHCCGSRIRSHHRHVRRPDVSYSGSVYSLATDVPANNVCRDKYEDHPLPLPWRLPFHSIIVEISTGGSIRARFSYVVVSNTFYLSIWHLSFAAYGRRSLLFPASSRF